MSNPKEYIYIYVFGFLSTLLWASCIEFFYVRQVSFRGILSLWPFLLPAFICSTIGVHLFFAKNIIKQFFSVPILNLAFIIIFFVSVIPILDFLSIKVYS